MDTQPAPGELIAQREEALAYANGLQAYIYAYPALDYMRVMREQTVPGLDPHGVYGPLNTIVFQDALAEPGGFYKGRAPSADTIYFTAWIDTSRGPVTVCAPDTNDRYYSLTFSDLYLNVQHTGRRTTGTKQQTITVVGPDWKGDGPDGSHVIRLATRHGYLLGRLLVHAPDDLEKAQALLRQFSMSRSAIDDAPGENLPTRDDLQTAAAFRFINRFLRENPRMPGEEALMYQFDSVGFGPGRVFDAAQISEATRKGLERAAADGYALLNNAMRTTPPFKGWTPIMPNFGKFGFDYYWRAVIEVNGFLVNLPEEAVYPATLTDASGQMLDGANRYRLVFPEGQLPPQDAFWSVTPYAVPDMDLIPNPASIYSLGNRAGPLRQRADGATEIRIQATRPDEADVNWLPVRSGPFMLSFRICQPRPEVIDGRYQLPPVERLS